MQKHAYTFIEHQTISFFRAIINLVTRALRYVSLKKRPMGRSLVKCFMHLIFSTKHRKPQIDESIESELHRYLGGICTQLQCPPIKIGGYVDHVHLLYMQSKKIALMKGLHRKCIFNPGLAEAAHPGLVSLAPFGA